MARRSWLHAAPSAHDASYGKQQSLDIPLAAVDRGLAAGLPAARGIPAKSPHGSAGQPALLTRQPSNSQWQLPLLLAQPASPVDELLITFILESRRLARLQPLELIIGPLRQDLAALLGTTRARLEPFGQQHASTVEIINHGPPGQYEQYPQSTGISTGIHAGTTQIAASLARPTILTSTDYAASKPAVCSSAAPLASFTNNLFDAASFGTLLDRLAGFAVTARLLAWLVKPSQATYAVIPYPYRPLPCQADVPHPPWVDFLIWPALRAAVLQRPEVYLVEEFLNVWATSLRLVPFPPRGVARTTTTTPAAQAESTAGPAPELQELKAAAPAVSPGPAGLATTLTQGQGESAPIVSQVLTTGPAGQVWLTQAFEQHALNPRNWRVTARFLWRYPELRHCVLLEGVDD